MVLPLNIQYSTRFVSSTMKTRLPPYGLIKTADSYVALALLIAFRTRMY